MSKCRQYQIDIDNIGDAPPYVRFFKRWNCESGPGDYQDRPRPGGGSKNVEFKGSLRQYNDEISSVVVPKVYTMSVSRKMEDNFYERGKWDVIKGGFADNVGTGKMSDIGNDSLSSYHLYWNTDYADYSGNPWDSFKWNCCTGKNHDSMCGIWKPGTGTCNNYMANKCSAINALSGTACQTYFLDPAHKSAIMDRTAINFCKDRPYNKGGDFCSCLKSPVLDTTINFHPYCIDSACQNPLAYKDANTKGMSCPPINFIDCRQVEGIAEGHGNIFIDNQQIQNCFIKNGNGEPPVNGVPPPPPPPEDDDNGIPPMMIVMIFIFVVVVAALAYYLMFVRAVPAVTT